MLNFNCFLLGTRIIFIWIVQLLKKADLDRLLHILCIKARLQNESKIINLVDPKAGLCLVCVMQIAGGGGSKAHRAGAYPPAAAAGYLSDKGWERGAGKSAFGERQCAAGSHAAAPEAGDRETECTGAVWGTTKVFVCP